MTPALYNQMIVHWWRNEQGTVVYDFSYLRSRNRTGGEVASADGLRFVVPVRTLHAGYNSTYFHVERGVTYYNFTSNQFSGFHGIVIPGALHDSPYVLDGLLEHQIELQHRQLMTDSAGYSDMSLGSSGS